MSGNEQLSEIAKLISVGAGVGQGFADYSAGSANAAMLREQAGYAASAAASRESVVRSETQQIIGRQIAAIGASGLTYEGSPMDVVRQNAVEREMEALNVRYAGQVQVIGFMSQAAEADRAAKEALYSGIAKSGTELLMAGAKDTAPPRRPTADQIAKIPLVLDAPKMPSTYNPPVPRRKPLVRVN